MNKIVLIVVAIIVVAGAIKQCQTRSSNPTSDVATPATQSTTAAARQLPGSAWPPLEQYNVGDGDAAQVNLTASPSNNVNYYIVFDGSGSMMSRECSDGKTKIDAAVQAVKDFVLTAPADANIGLTAFDRKEISERVKLGADNRDALIDALQKIRAGSDTPLRSSIKIGYDKLTEQARAQLGYGEYHLIVVTDGRPQPSSEDPSPIVNEILAKSPVVLHTIGFCIDSNHVLNQQGRTYYASANNPQELQQSLRAVLAEAAVFDAASFN